MTNVPSFFRRLALAVLTLSATSCAADPMAPGLDGGFVISDHTLVTRRFVGAEALRLNLVIASHGGRFIQSYGVKTPYEETVRPILPKLPMPISQGFVDLKLDSFTRLPKGGEMPIEFWLVDDTGAPSNRITDTVTIQ